IIAVTPAYHFSSLLLLLLPSPPPPLFPYTTLFRSSAPDSRYSITIAPSVFYLFPKARDDLLISSPFHGNTNLPRRVALGLEKDGAVVGQLAGERIGRNRDPQIPAWISRPLHSGQLELQTLKRLGLDPDDVFLQ